MISDSHNNPDDQELLVKYKEHGDLSIIGTLFKRYKHLVYGVCMKYLKDPEESEEVVMQIFEKLITDLRKHTVLNFRAWLHTVTKNHCLMVIRKNKSRGYQNSERSDTSLEVVEMNSLWHPEQAEKESSLQLLEQSIPLLNDEQRNCIELFYLKEKSYSEVSAITGYTMLQVKSYIQNGKRNLKIIMEKKHAG